MPSQYERSCVKYDNTLNQFSIHTITNIYALRIIYMYAYCSSVAVLYLSVLHSSVFAVFVGTCIKVRKKYFLHAPFSCSSCIMFKNTLTNSYAVVYAFHACWCLIVAAVLSVQLVSGEHALSFHYFLQVHFLQRQPVCLRWRSNLFCISGLRLCHQATTSWRKEPAILRILVATKLSWGLDGGMCWGWMIILSYY